MGATWKFIAKLCEINWCLRWIHSMPMSVNKIGGARAHSVCDVYIAFDLSDSRGWWWTGRIHHQRWRTKHNYSDDGGGGDFGRARRHGHNNQWRHTHTRLHPRSVKGHLLPRCLSFVSTAHRLSSVFIQWHRPLSHAHRHRGIEHIMAKVHLNATSNATSYLYKHTAYAVVVSMSRLIFARAPFFSLSLSCIPSI